MFIYLFILFIMASKVSTLVCPTRLLGVMMLGLQFAPEHQRHPSSQIGRLEGMGQPSGCVGSLYSSHAGDEFS
jgi:hypothetical protein